MAGSQRAQAATANHRMVCVLATALRIGGIAKWAICAQPTPYRKIRNAELDLLVFSSWSERVEDLHGHWLHVVPMLALREFCLGL